MSTVCARLDTSNEMALAESSTKEALSWIFQRRAFQDQRSDKKRTPRSTRKYWIGGIILIALLLLLTSTLNQYRNNNADERYLQWIRSDREKWLSSNTKAEKSYQECVTELKRVNSARNECIHSMEGLEKLVSSLAGTAGAASGFGTMVGGALGLGLRLMAGV